MNVLVLGSGGREHAISWKIAQSPKINQLFIAPGNAGTASLGTNVALSVNDFDKIGHFILENDIDMLVVGPEDPLVRGIYDHFKKDERFQHLAVIGPSSQAAMLEGSKDFAKSFMKKNNIPTAAYQSFTAAQIEEGIRFLEQQKPPYVLKADGLAAGKGVLICQSLEEAITELRAMLEDAKFGEASNKVVIEEFLEGVELSVFVLTDGKSYLILPEAKDYKRIGEGDTGLNTGGMGSISPVPFADKRFMKKVEDRIIKPTIKGLNEESISYQGFIFFGLINIQGEPFVIEYNARMGDPEAESVIPRIKTDLLDLFDGVAKGTLNEKSIAIDKRFTAAIFLVSGGYPEDYEKGKQINGLDKVNHSIVFHAGTTRGAQDKIYTNGGRVIAITSYGNTMKEALDSSYANAALVEFDKKYYRNDLGFDL
ncbi:MAG: phosphoribosylamine--glycine ligase [Bacteroidota bacterium]|nr:phosphoribosylamine--glycine ligase [Bacteroidota bacterium]